MIQWSVRSTDEKCSLLFYTAIIFSLITWTILPSIFLKHNYIDVIESIMWGRHLHFGYSKNPYLPAFVTYFIYIFSGGWMKIFYLACAAAHCIGVWAMWKLARNLLPPIYALISALLLLCCHFYSSGGVEFNDDIMQLALWPLTAYVFYKAVEKNNYRYWLLTGFFAALALMTKYLGAPLLLGMFIFSLINRNARKCYKTPAIYSGTLLFLFITFPHIIFLFNNDFISFHYALGRSGVLTAEKINLWNHFSSSFRFICTYIFSINLPLILITIICFFIIKGCRKDIKIGVEKWSFIILVGYTPVIFLFFFSLFTGGKVLYDWNTPLSNFSGILLICLLKPDISSIRLKTFAALFISVFIFWCCDFIIKVSIRPYLKEKPGRYEFFPGNKVAEFATCLWNEKYGTSLKYVGGSTELAGNISIFSSDHPKPFIDMDIKQNPWIDIEDFKENGGIVAYRTEAFNIERFKETYTEAILAGIYSFPSEAIKFFKDFLGLKPIPDIKVAFFYFPPKNSKK